jgi:hypothetical protein
MTAQMLLAYPEPLSFLIVFLLFAACSTSPDPSINLRDLEFKQRPIR